MKQKYCLPIIKNNTKEVLKIISENKNSYDFFEIWLDYIEDINPEIIKHLINEFDSRLIFLFRRQNLESSKMNFKTKIEIMMRIENSKCFLDLDISQKKELEYLKKNLNGIKLILSYHNYTETPSDEKLKDIIDLMKENSPSIYKISTFSNSTMDSLRLMDLLLSLREDKVKYIILGMGTYGRITRIAGAILGNEFTFVPLKISEISAKGQLTKNNLEKILKKIKLCYSVGNPIKQSMSPIMHNEGYRIKSIENKFIYLRRRVMPQDLKSFIYEIRSDPTFRGASITVPHKIEIMQYLDQIEPVAKKIGAVNTVVKDGKKLKGYNTDYLGILKPLKKILTLKGKSAAVLGAGGAARAAVYTLTSEGARVSIFNRSLENAKKLAKDFRSNSYSLSEIEKISQFDIIINATSVGLDQTDSSLLSKNLIRANQVIFDVVYSKDNNQTKLIKNAKEKKAKVITGLDMLVYQGVEQFKIFTKKSIKPEIMRKAI